MSPLFATHDGAIKVLGKRLEQGLASDPVIDEIPPPAAVLKGKS